MKVCLFGCKDTTMHVARFLRRNGVEIHLVTIAPETAQRNEVAGYEDLTKARDVFDSIYVAASYSLSSETDKAHFHANAMCKIGFCIGWQRLIPAEILECFTFGVFGMHGSARDLPFGKGRSPMNWALLEGRNHFFTNLFKYNANVDDGPIVDTRVFSIQPQDTAETLHYKNLLSMCHIIETHLPRLLQGKVTSREQCLSDGESFYPKRTPSDGVIDWRDDIHNIERLVRAVTHPFFGALAYLGKQELRIYRASVFYTDIESHGFHSAATGEVLDVFPNGKFLVRCAGGALIVHEYSPFDVHIGDVFDQQASPFVRFSRNAYGFFDT